MLFQQIPNTPAIFIKKYHLLILSDLHIGIENQFNDFGVHIESSVSFFDTMLFDLCKTYHPKEIIILGDIKHTIPSTPFYEQQHLFDFLEKIQNKAQVHIITGNHDGGIKNIIPQDIILHSSEGYQKDVFGFIHGHRWPSEQIMHSSYLFCGHTHPTIKFTDQLGHQSYEPCWIKSTVNKENASKRYQSFNKECMIMIFPVFNPLCGGSAINEEGIVGPMKHLIDQKTTEIYLLDGTFMGTVDKLKKAER